MGEERVIPPRKGNRAGNDIVAALRKEWDDLAAAAEREEDEETRAARRNLGKLRKGLRTPEAAYYHPILMVLDRMGGSGKVGGSST